MILFFVKILIVIVLAGEFLLISGRSVDIWRRQVDNSPVANPEQAANLTAEAGDVNTSERFGLIGSLIAKHKMKQAMKHGMMPFNPMLNPGFQPGFGPHG